MAGALASFPLDAAHLHAAGRYVELNPVRAGLVERAENWPWSSARAHLEGHDDGLVTVGPLLERIVDWPAYLRAGLRAGERETLRRHERTGRPLGSDAFIAALEDELGRRLKKRKPGRAGKSAAVEDPQALEAPTHPEI